jgi:hypothetical protein
VRRRALRIVAASIGRGACKPMRSQLPAANTLIILSICLRTRVARAHPINACLQEPPAPNHLRNSFAPDGRAEHGADRGCAMSGRLGPRPAQKTARHSTMRGATIAHCTNRGRG